MEIRNPKHEIRRKSEIGSTKSEENPKSEARNPKEIEKPEFVTLQPFEAEFAFTVRPNRESCESARIKWQNDVAAE
jgi:hypothetical protein